MPDTENVIQLSKLFSVSIDFLLNDNICSEADIPAVQHNTTVLQDKFRSKILLVIGFICSAMGCAGSITLIVLSTMIKVHVEKKRILPDGSVQYYGGGDILGYDFWKFISEYRLQALLFICIILIIAGIAIYGCQRRRLKLKAYYFNESRNILYACQLPVCQTIAKNEKIEFGGISTWQISIK